MLKQTSEIILARHSIIEGLLAVGLTNMTEVAKTMIDSNVCHMAFLKKNGLLQDYEEFVNELKIDINTEEQNVQNKD